MWLWQLGKEQVNFWAGWCHSHSLELAGTQEGGMLRIVLTSMTGVLFLCRTDDGAGGNCLAYTDLFSWHLVNMNTKTLTLTRLWIVPLNYPTVAVTQLLGLRSCPSVSFIPFGTQLIPIVHLATMFIHKVLCSLLDCKAIIITITSSYIPSCIDMPCACMVDAPSQVGWTFHTHLAIHVLIWLQRTVAS